MQHTRENDVFDAETELAGFEERLAEVLGKKELQTSEKLLASVLLCIEREGQTQEKRRHIYMGAAFVFAAVFAFFVNAFRVEGAQSGLVELLSLFISDTAFIAREWRDYGYSLLEALPIASAALALTSLWLAVVFLKKVTDYSLHARFTINHMHI